MTKTAFIEIKTSMNGLNRKTDITKDRMSD